MIETLLDAPVLIWCVLFALGALVVEGCAAGKNLGPSRH